MTPFECPVDSLMRSNRRLKWTVAFLVWVILYLVVN